MLTARALPGGRAASDGDLPKRLGDLGHYFPRLLVGTDGMANDITLLGDTQVFRRFRQFLGELRWPVAAYLLGAVVVTIGLATVLATSDVGIGPLPAVAALAGVAALTEWRGRIVLRGHLTVSISLFPSVFAATLFGPLAGLVVFGASALGCSFLPWAGRAVYLSNRAVAGAAAGGAAVATAHLIPSGPGQVVAAATVAALTAELADTLLTSFVYALRGIGRWTEAVRDLLPVVVASVPFYGPAVAVLVLAYRDVSPWTLPLFLAPALAAPRRFLMYQ